MNNRVILISLVILASIFVGVTLVVQKSDRPVAQRLLMQQERILDMQQSMSRKISSMGGDQATRQQLANLLAKQSVLESRMSALEAKLNSANLQARNVVPTQPPAPQGPQGPPPDEYTKVHEIPVGNSPFKGKKDAPVTITEFTDIQCPFCARFHPVLDEVSEAFPGKVKVVMKNFPLSFHQQAKPAAKAALAAGEQGKYFEMLELMLGNQQNLTSENFEKWAKDIGLNVRQFKKDLEKNDAKYEKAIQDDLDLGRKVEVRGTPTYYINGRKTMARDLASYKREVQAALDKM